MIFVLAFASRQSFADIEASWNRLAKTRHGQCSEWPQHSRQQAVNDTCMMQTRVKLSYQQPTLAVFLF